MELFKIYSSDISDLEWEWIEPLLPKDKLLEGVMNFALPTEQIVQA